MKNETWIGPVALAALAACASTDPTRREAAAANVDERPRDRKAFDRWIVALEAEGR